MTPSEMLQDAHNYANDFFPDDNEKNMIAYQAFLDGERHVQMINSIREN